MIQIITNNAYKIKPLINNTQIIFSEYGNYKSFDLYDVNIINLSDADLWHNKGSSTDSIDEKGNLVHIKKSIETCNSKILVIMPQNYNYQYHYSSIRDKYNGSTQLKNMNLTIQRLLQDLIFDKIPVLNFEKGITKINGEVYNSDFYFNKNSTYDVIIECEKSKKINTIRYNEEMQIVLTTLNILECNKDVNLQDRLFNFLNNIRFLEKNNEIPEWISDISFYDDEEYQKIIDETKDKIIELNKIIETNENKLKINDSYKSILYSFGSDLSEQINSMLKKIFLLEDEFVDVYEEDFKFKFNDVTFVVETKGLTNEVAGKNVSDAYDHLVLYEDELEQKGIKEQTKCLFFVANERLKNPKNRVKIKDRQITIAKRNKTLIIDTVTFYKLFQDYCQSKITSDDVFKIFNNQVGLINYK